MKNKLSFLGFVLLVSTLIISGCALTTDETTEVPVVVTTDVTPEGPVDIEYAVARDAALAYISEKHGEQPPPSGSAWEWESPAPDPLAGPDSYQYTAGDWEATISRLVVVPDSAAYRVKVINRSTGFRWDGEVDAVAQVTELPPREPPKASEWVLDARDAALAHLIENYGDQAPPSDLTWPEEYISPEGWVGWSDWEFTAEDWVVTIGHAVLPPERTVYQVTVANRTTGFQWEGEVDAAAQVTELSVSTGPFERPALAWYGRVVSLPAGSQFDDYLALLPEGTVEVGIEGADAATQAEIVALRDAEHPAHFWGTLICPAVDYGGCELVVSRLRPSGPGPFFDPDPVEGWEGVIYSGPPGLQVDDYFVLVGDFNLWYGIWSPDSAINSQLEGLRDTGTVIKVWGELMTGVMDGNGTQVQVDRFEIVEEPSGVVPPAPDWPEADDGKEAYINADHGYQLRVPPVATITEFGPVMFSPDEVPEGMTDEEYMAQLQEQYGDKLCVYIEYALGYIYISAPPNQGEGFRYYPCGLTGLGAGEIVQKTKEVMIAGQTYTAQGFEWIGDTAPCSPPRETLDCHNETMIIELEDGTRIEYGARYEPTATYKDYLMKGRDMLLEILASYETVPDAQGDPYPGWASYVNTDYGFAFRYVTTWSLEERPEEEMSAGLSAKSVVLRQGTLRLVIQYKRPAEELILGPGGVPAGDTVDRGTVTFLGRELPKHVLVFEGKDKSVFYGDRFEELEFYIQLDDDPGVGVDYRTLEIPENVQAEVDQILESFELVLTRE